MRVRRAAIALLAAPLLSTCVGAPGAAAAGTICEFPHPDLIVQFHPRSETPLVLSHIDRALEAGVHRIELDLRLRPADQAVVCSHSANGLEDRSTLAASIDRSRGRN